MSSDRDREPTHTTAHHWPYPRAVVRMVLEKCWKRGCRSDALSAQHRTSRSGLCAKFDHDTINPNYSRQIKDHRCGRNQYTKTHLRQSRKRSTQDATTLSHGSRTCHANSRAKLTNIHQRSPWKAPCRTINRRGSCGESKADIFFSFNSLQSSSNSGWESLFRQTVQKLSNHRKKIASQPLSNDIKHLGSVHFIHSRRSGQDKQTKNSSTLSSMPVLAIAS